jgi:general secretion pathway protein E
MSAAHDTKMIELGRAPAPDAPNAGDALEGVECVEAEIVGVVDAVDAVDMVVVFDAEHRASAGRTDPVEAANAPPSSPALSEDALRVAVSRAAETGRAPIAVLAETSGLAGDALASALGAALRYPVLDSAGLMALAPAFDLLGPADAARRGCVVARRDGEALAVIGDPFDLALRGWLELKVPQALSWHLAAPDEIRAFVAKHEQDLRAMDVAAVATGGEKLVDGALENLSLASISADSSPVVKLVHSTVYDALKAGASDIHLETRPGGLAVRYRLDGVLVHVATLGNAELCEQVISRVKVMSELDIAERRVPQDGRFRLALKGRPIDFRVSVMPSVHGEDAVLRILDKQALTDELQGLRLDALGFEDGVVRRLRRLSELPYGMLLVTGPTGSGKTTTLYAAISETNTGRDKIVTIEDPVEYQLPGVLQIPVNEKKGLTFARGLRSILRHDPDKIMVGEIRDPETAQIAIQSALTGHLVFTTVHANNVFDVLGRFAHMQADAYALVSALNGILAQRLVRVVCEQCAEPDRPPLELVDESGLAPPEISDWTFRLGRGCAHCRGTGYKGRRAIGELLILNDELREAIVARAPARRLKELALAGGSKLLRSAALELVQQGVTTLLEANRVTALA